jgi:hypothetical protein
VRSERSERQRTTPAARGGAGGGNTQKARQHKKTLLVAPREHWPRITAGLSMELVRASVGTRGVGREMPGGEAEEVAVVYCLLSLSAPPDRTPSVAGLR